MGSDDRVWPVPWAQGHVTNYAQNKDGDVWDLDRLRLHLGEDNFSKMYRWGAAASDFTGAALRTAKMP